MKDETISALYRENFYYFVQGAFECLYNDKEFFHAKHLKLLSRTLQNMQNNPGECNLITMPPRYCKSFVASICYPAWALGRNPALKFLVVSYGDALANEHASAFKNIIASDWYKRLFPDLKVRQDRVGQLKTTAGGYRLSISVGGAATGFGADIIIIDDIIKAGDVVSEAKREEAKRSIDETIFSRLDKKSEGHIVAIQQRLHEDDPAAYMETKGFKRLCLKAIAEEDETWDLGDEIWRRRAGDPLFPELEDLETLEKIKATLTPRVFSAQYQQNPINGDGNRIAWQKIGTFNEPFSPNNYTRIIQSWDTACTNEATSDYSACATLGYHLSGVWHLLDIHRARYDFVMLEAVATSMIEKWRPNVVLVENAGAGYALVDRLNQRFAPQRRSTPERYIWSMTPRFSKEERVFIHQHYLEQKIALIPKTATWLPDFRNEVLAFPSGRYDDQIDALFQIFSFLELPRGRGFMNRNPETGRVIGKRRIRR